MAEHLRLAARLRGAGDADGAELLELLGLADRRRHLPRQLSGGEQQRLAFARAVVGTRRWWWRTSHRRAGPGLGRGPAGGGRRPRRPRHRAVLATHDPAVVRLAERTVFLRHGAMEAEATRQEALSVIDEAGRVQPPPEVLESVPSPAGQDRRGGGRVWVEPP